MSKKLPQLIVILGPTASGKTGLSLSLAQNFNGQIISADSRQIYRGMDIGTDKTTDSDIPHHLIDIANPDEEFTLSDYQQAAFKIIESEPTKLNFLVGGTGLYISAIVDNLQIPAVKPDEKLRSKLQKMSSKKLLAELKKLDPVSAQKIDPQNKRRLIRAIEVCQVTGQPFSEQTTKGEPRVEALQIGLDVPREKLYTRINQRVDEMITAGLVDEVKNLLAKGYSKDLPAFSGIGYKEIISYLEKEISLDEATELIKRNTRRYAKKQLTWFRRDKNIRWVKNYQEAEKLVENFLPLN
ncbi:MAG: tRNA (adenosine(37)-N6)-dimethylallyltransferase MiaA [Parcubacteria group bacterium]|nr:tRNA (adenosine(37)-N6)-dimethylallyltransferase MiaA [Parcubacteria group bacterium]